MSTSTARSWGRILVVAALAAVVAGAGLFAVLSLVYQPKLYALHEEARFGTFDPHLSVAVKSASWDARGVRVDIVVRNTSQEREVDPRRLNLVVLDAAGHEVGPEVCFDDEPLRAGGLRTYPYRFHVPPDARQPRLWITRRNPLTKRIPVLDRTILTGKLVYPLPPPPEALVTGP